MNEQAIRRVRGLARVLLCLAVAIVGRLLWLQVFQHDYYQRLAQRQQEKVLTIQAERGKILDRGGQRLAVSRPLDSLCVNPLLLNDMPFSADLLATVLQVDHAT